MSGTFPKVLIEGFPFFRFRNKWKKRRCSLVKSSNFSSTLKLFINKKNCEELGPAEYVHSFDIGVHIISRPSILLICTHRVHCMTFEVFDDLRSWADTLQENLVCARFFASIFSAPKSNRFHFLVPSSQMTRNSKDLLAPEQLHSSELTQTRSDNSVSTKVSSNASSLSPNCFSNFLSRVIHLHHNGNGEGFLHVTVDRLLFVTFTSGRKPSLIASWNFTSGEISIYGTGRVSLNSGDSCNRIFYLIESTGRYVFACDKAAELSAWIQRATRPASYLYERRWLSSVTAQLGDQAMLLLPYDGAESGRKVFGASLSDISESQTDSTQPTPFCATRQRNDSSSSSIYLRHIRGRGTYRARMRFLSHPTDRPLLSSEAFQTSRQQNGCVLRHSYSNIATLPQASSTEGVSSTCGWGCQSNTTSSTDGTEDRAPAMVALSPLPLDYLPAPRVALDETDTGLEVDVNHPINLDVHQHNQQQQQQREQQRQLFSAKERFQWRQRWRRDTKKQLQRLQQQNCGTMESSCSSNPSLQSSSPSSAPSPPRRQESSDAGGCGRLLEDSWTTGTLSGSISPPSGHGIPPTTVNRAASECRDSVVSTRQRSGWLPERQYYQPQLQQQMVGVTCSVPWDAAPTGEKPRTGRLYSSREEIREAAMRAAAAPLSSLPSQCPSPSPSTHSDEHENDGATGQGAYNGPSTSGQSRQASSTSPPSYVNIRPATNTSADGIAPDPAQQQQHRQWAVVSLFPLEGTTTTGAAATAVSSSSPNYLSYSPYVPLLSQQRSGAHLSNVDRTRTLSGGQTFARRNAVEASPNRNARIPNFLPPDPTLRSELPTSSPVHPISVVPPPPPPQSDLSKLPGCQSNRHLQDQEEIVLSDQSDFSTSAVNDSGNLAANRTTIRETTTARTEVSMSTTPEAGSDQSTSNYVVVNFEETHALSRLVQRMASEAFNSHSLIADLNASQRSSTDHHLRRLCNLLLSRSTSPVRELVTTQVEGTQQSPPHSGGCLSGPLLGSQIPPSAQASPQQQSPTSRPSLLWWILKRRSSLTLRNSR